MHIKERVRANARFSSGSNEMYQRICARTLDFGVKVQVVTNIEQWVRAAMQLGSDLDKM
jgi:hypothetical protein